MGLRVDCRSDLFSLGTLLYEMLTLTAPFCAVDDIVLLFAVRDVKMRPIGELRRDLDRELQALVGRAMAKSPEQRFQSGEELAEALSAFLKTHYPSYSTNDLRAYLQHMSSEQEEILIDDAYVEEIDEVEEVEALDETEASGTSGSLSSIPNCGSGFTPRCARIVISKPSVQTIFPSFTSASATAWTGRPSSPCC